MKKTSVIFTEKHFGSSFLLNDQGHATTKICFVPLTHTNNYHSNTGDTERATARINVDHNRPFHKLRQILIYRVHGIIHTKTKHHYGNTNYIKIMAYTLIIQHKIYKYNHNYIKLFKTQLF